MGLNFFLCLGVTSYFSYKIGYQDALSKNQSKSEDVRKYLIDKKDKLFDFISSLKVGETLGNPTQKQYSQLQNEYKTLEERLKWLEEKLKK